MFTPEQVRAAIATHSTLFFDHDLNPVVPQPAQWFCEYDIIDTYEGDEIVRDEALVEYLGREERRGPGEETRMVDVVWDEQCDATRQPRGWVLIKQI